MVKIEIKKKLFQEVVFISILLLLFINRSLEAAIPGSEREALIAFYNATNGDEWKNNSGWKGNNEEFDDFSAYGSEGTWFGVTTADGHVTKIYTRSNDLRGNLPPGLANLTQLEELVIENESNLSGKIPPELGHLADLKTLIIEGTMITGGIHPLLGNLEKLEKLVIRNRVISVNLPRHSDHDTRESMRIEEMLKYKVTHLSGPIPPELGNLVQLKTLDLEGNNLSGSIPGTLGKLSQLEILNLGKNQLSGSIPMELGNLGNLHTLLLGFNQLTGFIPPHLGKAGKLEILKLNNNRLKGSIPGELGNLSNLRELNLSRNRLGGGIPPELGNSLNLKDLNLAYNRLEGGIPPELVNIYELQYLYLNNNRLSGSLPSALGHFTALLQVFLNSNRFSGEIPAAFRSLSGCYIIDISYNALRRARDDDVLPVFLSKRGARWEATQTTAPLHVKALPLSPSSIKLSWKPTRYIGDKGGYDIYYKTKRRSPWILAGKTLDKSAKSYVVRGLNPGKKYDFVIQTRTDPHVENANTVLSEFSKEVSAATLVSNK